MSIKRLAALAVLIVLTGSCRHKAVTLLPDAQPDHTGVTIIQVDFR